MYSPLGQPKTGILVMYILHNYLKLQPEPQHFSYLTQWLPNQSCVYSKYCPLMALDHVFPCKLMLLLNTLVMYILHNYLKLQPEPQHFSYLTQWLPNQSCVYSKYCPLMVLDHVFPCKLMLLPHSNCMKNIACYKRLFTNTHHSSTTIHC